MEIRRFVPWWVKIILKLILSRLNVSYGFWQKLEIFRHGMMDDPDYAFTTFLRHYNSVNFQNKGDRFVMLELGPGDSLASGIIARCFGADKSYLVDKGGDAIASSKSYETFYGYLSGKFNDVDFDKECLSIDELLNEWRIEYLTNGLDSLRKIPDGSVDYLWTQSVLEHIEKSQFVEYIKQFRRVISENGVCVHGVDLKDHMSYSHNNLRFSDKIWESDFMASSGFYTNRILYSGMIDIFENCGFGVETLNIIKWENIPTARHKLSEEFQNLSDEDLLISDFDVALRPV